jgi:hypothetical protein
MTLDEARNRIGQLVVYRAPHLTSADQGDQGVITSVNDRYVFVRYGSQQTSQATPVELLTAVS